MTQTSVQRINMITLAVADLAKSKKFYSDMGWEMAQTGDENIAFYTLEGQYMALYPRDKLTEDIGMPIHSRATGSITMATNYATKEDVDAAWKVAISAGATPITKPEMVFWGGYSGYFADPDGHMWEVAMNPFWKLDELGMIAGDA